MWIDPTVLKQHGVPVMEVDVGPGCGMWVPYNLPHLVINTENLTVAIAYSVLLPWSLKHSYKCLHINRKFCTGSKDTVT